MCDEWIIIQFINKLHIDYSQMVFKIEHTVCWKEDKVSGSKFALQLKFLVSKLHWFYLW